MQLKTVKIEKPDDTNFILGQTHFIKSVEDIHEALVIQAVTVGIGWCFIRSVSHLLWESRGQASARGVTGISY